MVKLVYTRDLKSRGLKNRVGSIPASGTHTPGDWRNWLARTVWDREAAGSNPVSPTIDDKALFKEVFEGLI